MFMLITLLSLAISVATSEYASTCKNFDCEYKLLSKLIHLEDNAIKQDNMISLLTAKLEDAETSAQEDNKILTARLADAEKTAHEDKNILTARLEDAEKTILRLKDTLESNQKYADGTTYIRWGRTTCPGKAVLVYDGYVAGSHFKHSGTGSNPLCLPKDPDYDKHTNGFQAAARIYGAEYQTSFYGHWKHLHGHEIPCAVCRIPRNNVLMVPGKNRCHDNYILEYKGYLMAEHWSHVSSSEYVCVDESPETLEGTHQDRDGQLFYFVEGECGSLRCDLYKNGWELTCAVCSYVRDANSTSVQPYT